MTIEQTFEDFCQVRVYRACLPEIVFAREMAREMTCGFTREMTCGFTKEMTCGFRSHLATSQLIDLNHSSANFGEALVVD